MKELTKQLRVIEEKWGIQAYKDIVDVLVKKEMRIDDLTESRENWKKKYKDLKEAKC